MNEEQSIYFDDTVQLVEVVMPHQSRDYDYNDSAGPPSVVTRGHSNINGEPQQTENVAADSTPRIKKWKANFTVAILVLVNLLNYMDRFTVAGVLIHIKKYYHDIGNSEAGNIQTAFVYTYMVFSPIFGYLGDRYCRKYIMGCGIFLWSAFTMGSSFMPDDYFWAFVFFRALVGIGEASYSTIAPTIIADLYAKEDRTKALMVFYFALPVGSGLGYIVGSEVAHLLGAWQWALRVTPVLGVICVILILMFCEEPPRGMSEGGDVHLTNTSVFTDLKDLLKNKSFMLSTLGFTCVAFVTGSLAFFAPTFMVYSTEFQNDPKPESEVSLIFGGITVAAGFIGVGVGAESARRYKRINPRADPLICAFGMLTCVPFLFFAVFLSKYNTAGTWVLIFLGSTMLCLNWAVTADILLYVVIPTRRSLAEAGQILLSHALGDAISPKIIGSISDALAEDYPDPGRPSVQFLSMQTALYLTTFICVFGGAFYLATAIFIERDKKRADKITHSHGDTADFMDDDPLVSGPEVNFLSEEESLSEPPFMS